MSVEAQPWLKIGEVENWSSSLEVTKDILGRNQSPIPLNLVHSCAKRLFNLRTELQETYVGLDEVIDWLLAVLIARENVLLLGTPGVAKSELATRLFQLLGLKQPEVNSRTGPPRDDLASLKAWWETQGDAERENQKYFHYLLSRFTQPEELFGPIEISLLRQGVFVRVNFGLLTGPGVRAAFLDEIFKASSSILNTLLALTQERQYFNWSGMMPSDLIMLIGASNELPGDFSSGTYGLGSSGDDFQMLYAFLDRFPIRLVVPNMQGGDGRKMVEKSELARATKKAIWREGLRFTTGRNFKHAQAEEMPGINDILLLGRACMGHQMETGEGIFRQESLDLFWTAFIYTATGLQKGGTDLRGGTISWTISPRKLKALYKIGLAYALVCDQAFCRDQADIVDDIGLPALGVYAHAWDSPMVRDELKRLVNLSAKQFHDGS